MPYTGPAVRPLRLREAAGILGLEHIALDLHLAVIPDAHLGAGQSLLLRVGRNSPASTS